MSFSNFRHKISQVRGIIYACMIPGPEIIAKFHYIRDAYVWALGSDTMPMKHKLLTLIVKFIKHILQEYQGISGYLGNFGHSG